MWLDLTWNLYYNISDTLDTRYQKIACTQLRHWVLPTAPGVDPRQLVASATQRLLGIMRSRI